MAIPAKRHSTTRRDKRRTHFKIALPGLGECPQCHHRKSPHAVCEFCGYYKGKKLMPTREEELKAREEKRKQKHLRK